MPSAWCCMGQAVAGLSCWPHLGLPSLLLPALSAVITPTLAASNGDALAKGSYGPRAIVTVTDSARNNVLIKNQGAR